MSSCLPEFFSTLSSDEHCAEKVTSRMEDLRGTCYPLFQREPEQIVLEQIIGCPCPFSNDQFYKNLHKICLNIEPV